MKKYLVVNKDAYNNLADQYKSRLNEYKFKDKVLLATFINLAKTKADRAEVLELGPGSGLALQIFEEEGMRTYAIDIADKIIAVAKHSSPNTTFINDDFLQHDFGTKKFDAICAKAFLHLFPNDDAHTVLNKIADLTQENGALFLATTIHDAPTEGYEEKHDYSESPRRYRKKWTEAELLEALTHTWRIVEKNYNTERSKRWLALTLQKK